MSDLINIEQPLDDWGFALVAGSEAGPGLIAGLVIRFVKSTYPVGKDDGDISVAELVVQAAGSAWQRWEGNSLVDQIVRVAGERFPEREDLDSQDPSEWETGN